MNKDDRSLISWFAFAVAIAALVVAIVGVGGDSSSESASGGGGGEKPTIEVIMNDFSFTPANITIPAGGATLKLVNQGAAVHNLQVPDLGLKSPDVPAESLTTNVPTMPAR